MKIPKQINVKTALIFVVIGILLTSAIFYVLAATPSSTFYISSGVYPGAPSYTVWREGSNYFAKDANGLIAYSGTNFTTVMQNAHDTLPSPQGGDIYLASMQAQSQCIQITKNNVSISGSGWGTVLYPKTGTEAIFNVSGAHFRLHDIRLTGASVDGAHGVILTATADECSIYNCYINAFNQSAIETLSGCHVVYIYDNWLSSNGNTANSACLLLSSLSDSIIHNNQIGGGKYTIWVSGGYMLLTNNKIFGASDYHIYIDNPKRFIIDGNIIGGGTPYPQYDNICITGSTSYQEGSLITNNIFYSGGSPWGRDSIRFAGATCLNHTIAGNIFFNVTAYAVNEYHADADFNLITDNHFVNCSTPVHIEGDNTIVRGNIGFLTENSGSATIGASTSVVVTHGLAGTPTSITVTMGTTGPGYDYVTDVGATTFNVTVANSGTYTVYWYAEYKP